MAYDSTLPCRPSRQQQHDQAAQSPLKTPHDETAHVLPLAVQRAVEACPGTASRPPVADRDHEQDARPDHGPRPPRTSLDVAMRSTHGRIRSIDVLNSETSDSTVDTDAKGLDAARRRPGEDHFVTSNASLDDAVFTSSTGLAGFDSRRRDRILTLPGTRAVYGGWSDVLVLGTPGHAPYPRPARTVYLDRRAPTIAIDRTPPSSTV